MWIFVVFLAVPLIEIGLFVTLGGLLGLGLTLAFVVASSALGAALLRRGGASLRQAPGNPLMQAAGSGLSVLAAFLLILPGFLTSFLGLLLLVPMVQRGVIALVGQRLVAQGVVIRRSAASRDEVIDGEFSVMPEDRDERLPPSKWTRH